MEKTYGDTPWATQVVGTQVDPIEIEIRLERARQDAKFGRQDHDPFKYLTILGEEVGEASKAAIEAFNWKPLDPGFNPEKLAELRTELIQVAAVAKAIVECLDRGQWQS